MGRPEVWLQIQRPIAALTDKSCRFPQGQWPGEWVWRLCAERRYKISKETLVSVRRVELIEAVVQLAKGLVHGRMFNRQPRVIHQ